MRLETFSDPATLAQAAAEFLVRLGREATAGQGAFTLALSGGSTPRATFETLAREPLSDQLDWSRLTIFWSDERAVPPDDPESNYGMARRALLDRVPLPPGGAHRMPADRADLDVAAEEYEREIRREVPAGADGIPRFDLIMLGMGDDGHTASLFPQTAALDERERLVVANYVPKLGAHRLTFTPALINAAANVLFLVAGAEKAETLHAVLQGPHEPQRHPSQLVAPSQGTLYWYVDRAAASRLEGNS
jgi:6-phosphogluconolactonase